MELDWGVHDVYTINKYGENLLGSRQAIPRLLKLFTQYDIHATWAIVGMLYCLDKNELTEMLDEIPVSYVDQTLSPQHILKAVGKNEQEDPYHYAFSLIELIRETPNQEIGTHTFTHYYCLEKGQDVLSFEKDLVAAKKVENSISSLVFPRNQTNLSYLKVCKDYGILSYRGNEDHWIYRAYNKKENTPIKRILRLTDAYVNLTGHHTYSLDSLTKEPILNIPSSRFLRPYSKRLKILEGARLRRIKKSLTHAAKNDYCYHLWWHPHNFGVNLEENFLFLEEILKHVNKLKNTYGFQSLHMKEVTNLAMKNI